MLDDERIDDEDLLLSSPRILVTNVEDDDDVSIFLKEPVLEAKQKSEVHGPSWDDFVIEKVLGEGAYGKVYKVHMKQS